MIIPIYNIRDCSRPGCELEAAQRWQQRPASVGRNGTHRGGQCFLGLGFHLQKVVMKASNNGDERSTQMLTYPTHGDLPSGNQTWQLEIHYKWSF